MAGWVDALWLLVLMVVSIWLVDALWALVVASGHIDGLLVLVVIKDL